MVTGRDAIEAMDEMIRAINDIMDQNDEVCEELIKRYELVGEVWHDEKYAQLGDIMRDICVEMKSPQAKLSECITKTKMLRRAFEDYMNTTV